MVTREDLSKLFSRPDRTTNSVLTLYLDVASDEYLQKLQSLLDEQKTGIDDHFDAVHLLVAIQQLEKFFASYEPHGQSLIFIFDQADDFLWARELQVPSGNIIHWGVRPYVRPLAEAIDDFPNYAVAVTDQRKIRLFTVSLREIEEYRKPSLSVIDAIQRMVRSQRTSHLILAGPPDARKEVLRTMPKNLARLIVGTVDLPLTVESAEVLRRTLPLAEEFKRKEESEIIRDLTVQPAEGSWAVTGLGRTLDLLNQGRIWQLVYAEGLRGRALECRQCAAIFSKDRERCFYCGSSLVAVGNLLDLIYKHSFARGVHVRKLGPDVAAALSAVGSIGAFVKTAAASVNQRHLARHS